MSDPGKIGRLPGRIREQLSQRLYDGETESDILPWLNGLREVISKFGEDAINKDNLSRWRNGPYQEWLANRNEADDIRRVSELSFQLAKAAGNDISEGFLAVAAGKIQTLLQASDAETVNAAVASLVKLRTAELNTKKLKLDTAIVAQRERDLALREEKHRAQTAELFIKWADSAEAKAIMGSAKPFKVKAASLVKLFFGDRPAGSGGIPAADTHA